MDHAATTAVKPQVLEAMLPYFSQDFGNASSVYTEARTAREAVEKARGQVKQALNAAREDEIYFVSGGTEADNWALKGFALANQAKGRHIITTNAEHHAVLHTCEFLQKRDFEVTYLPVDSLGRVNAGQVLEAIRPDTILVSVMFANNEIGTVNPIAEIGRVCHEKGVTFHTDAVQAIGAVPVDVQAMNIDVLSLSAHKFYGPKGVGALYIRKGIRIENLIHGGAQERGKRGSTYNHPGIVGLGEAISLATADVEGHSRAIAALRDRLMKGILDRIPDVTVNGSLEHRLPNNLNVSFKYIESESVLLHLDLSGIAASSGSACTSGSLDPSHVLLAIGVKHGDANGSVRFSLGDDNTAADVDFVVDKLAQIVERLRAMSPLDEEHPDNEDDGGVCHVHG
jgi:cysteine desulfurase